MTPIRAVIVEDEAPARRKLKQLLAAAEDFEVVAECSTALAAVEAIRRQRPDVVFLDVELRNRTGFDVIEEIGVARMPGVVFVTGYDQHAVRAFEVNALDYLLKPFDSERFAALLVRVRERLAQRRTSAADPQLRALLAMLEAGRPEAEDAGPAQGPITDWIMVRDHQRVVRLLEVKDVDWIEASGNYVVLHVGARTYVYRASLAALADRLDPRRFARIHRGTIVRLGSVERMEPVGTGDYLVFLRTGATLKLSRSYREALEARLGAVG